MDKKKESKNENERDSLHPETIKGPQKDEHHNQYGDKDEATKVQ